jgi:hypothetical protein
MRIRDILYTLSVLIYGTGLSCGQFLINPYSFAAAGGGSGFLINETFEGTGFSDNSAAWTQYTTGSSATDPNYAYTFSGGSGSQSLRVVMASGAGAAHRTFTGTDNIYIYGRMRLVSSSTAADLIVADSGAFSSTAFVRLSGTKLRAFAEGGSPNDSSGNLPTATDLYIWVDITRGSGANHTVAVGWNTVATKPSMTATGATSAKSSNGTGTGQPTRLWLGSYSSHTAEVIFDDVQVSTSVIP